MSNIQACYASDELRDVDLHRNVTGQTSGGGGQPVENNIKVGSGVKSYLEKISGGQAERLFGRQSSSRWLAEFSSDAGVLPNDLIAVLTGPYAGTVIEVINTMVPLGELLVAECDDTPRAIT